MNYLSKSTKNPQIVRWQCFLLHIDICVASEKIGVSKIGPKLVFQKLSRNLVFQILDPNWCLKIRTEIDVWKLGLQLVFKNEDAIKSNQLMIWDQSDGIFFFLQK